jgi:hypothetical protein
MWRRIAGFTFIEFLAILLLLGVCVITAVPRVFHQSSAVRNASVAGIAGALEAAIGLAHTHWIANGMPPSVVIEGNTIMMTAKGVPECTNCKINGIVSAEKCLELWHGLMHEAPLAATQCRGKCEYLIKTVAAHQCMFVSEQGKGSGIVYDLQQGKILIK